jgi:hypothetical protein
MSSTRNFRDKVKMKYTRGIVPSEVNVPGSQFYGNLYGNSQMLNQIYGFLKKNPPNRPNPPPTPPAETKIVAILDFSDNVYNQPIIKTLNYYFVTVPRFYRFPIVNSGSNINNLINLLDEYYAKGFRYFYGFSTTTVLLAVLDWFNKHPDAQGVSGYSRLFTGEPKSVFRIQPQRDITITSIQLVNEYDAVFYIYNNVNPSFPTRGEYLKEKCNSLGIPYYSYPVNSISEITTGNFVNTTMSVIQEIITTNGYQKVSITSAMGVWQDTYYDTFVFGTTASPTNADFYNLTGFLPTITESLAQQYFQNVPLYGITTANLNSSPLWRQGLDNLGEQNFSTITLNIMELLYKLDAVNGYTNELGSYADSVIFDLVTRDQLYESVLYSLYSVNNIFVPSIIYYSDPDLNLFYKGFIE